MTTRESKAALARGEKIYVSARECVSGLHVPSNLRVIPATENLRKGAQLLLAAAA